MVMLDKKGGKVAFFSDENIGSKLMTMGILPGSDVRLVRKAPFGGCYYLKINGHNNIALRETEAEAIVLA